MSRHNTPPHKQIHDDTRFSPAWQPPEWAPTYTLQSHIDEVAQRVGAKEWARMLADFDGED